MRKSLLRQRGVECHEMESVGGVGWWKIGGNVDWSSGKGNAKGALDRCECQAQTQNDLFLSKDFKVATGDCPGQSAQVK